MLQAVSYIAKPDGRLPQIGDNDSGRLFRFELPDTEVLSVQYLLPLAASYFKDYSLNIQYEIPGESRFQENMFPLIWFFGLDGIRQFQEMPRQRGEYLHSKAFGDAGWYIMRKNKDYMIISCGPNGQKGRGGHAHNDKLSVELCLDGQDIFVDPGTYVYTPDPEMRNQFRATEYHNTVWVEGLEQNRVPREYSGLFWLYNEAKAKVLKWETGYKYDRFVGTHYGYKAAGLVHKREIQFARDRGIFTIRDFLEGVNVKEGAAIFHIAPGSRINMMAADAYKIGNALITFHGSAGVEMAEYYYSKEYGVKEPSKFLKVWFSGELATEIVKVSE
jgi:hypothetical protein